AGHVAVAVVDFHHLAVAVALARERDDPARHRDHVRALAAREIDAGVPGHLAAERVDAPAEAGGHPPPGHRPPGHHGTLLILAAAQQRLEHLELRLPGRELYRELIEALLQVRPSERFAGGTGRAANRRGPIERELAVVEVRDFG